MTDTNKPVIVLAPDMQPQTKALFGAYYDQASPPKAAITLPEGISVEHEDGIKILWNPLLVGGDLVGGPETRVTHVMPPQGQPFAWAYRLLSSVTWSTTYKDPYKTQSAAWRQARIIQPLYTWPAK
jgi:hypothetical protein